MILSLFFARPSYSATCRRDSLQKWAPTVQICTVCTSSHNLTSCHQIVVLMTACTDTQVQKCECECKCPLKCKCKTACLPFAATCPFVHRTAKSAKTFPFPVLFLLFLIFYTRKFSILCEKLITNIYKQV